ncbi:hypothetical protein [Streptomyces sp. NPDC003032]
MDLLRWWRFLWALDIEWNRATRMDARDFIRWMQIANKPQRLHWRHRKAGHSEETTPKPRTTRKKIPRYAERHHGQGLTWPAVRREDARALRNRAPHVLRLPPGRGHRADHQPVSARPLASQRPRERPPHA